MQFKRLKRLKSNFLFWGCPARFMNFSPDFKVNVAFITLVGVIWVAWALESLLQKPLARRYQARQCYSDLQEGLLAVSMVTINA